MTPPIPFEPNAIFECLLRHRVAHVVVGGLAGVAQGAGWPTYDADIVKQAGGETFESLVVDAVEAIQFGHRIRCASLDALLRMKRAANRPKDRIGIAKIEEALRDRRQDE